MRLILTLMMIAMVSGCGVAAKTYPSGVTFWGEGTPSWAKSNIGDAYLRNGDFCSPKFSGCKVEIDFFSDILKFRGLKDLARKEYFRISMFNSKNCKLKNSFVESGAPIVFEVFDRAGASGAGFWFNMFLYRKNMLLMEQGAALIVEVEPCAISETETIDKITLRIPTDVIHDFLYGSYSGAKKDSG
jgi:hypothetical protein